MELAFIAFYMPGMSLQLFIPCYFGTVTVYQANSLSVQCFASNWMGAGRNWKELFKMTMMKLTTSFTIFAGRLIPLNLSTFIVVKRPKIQKKL